MKDVDHSVATGQYRQWWLVLVLLLTVVGQTSDKPPATLPSAPPPSVFPSYGANGPGINQEPVSTPPRTYSCKHCPEAFDSQTLQPVLKDGKTREELLDVLDDFILGAIEQFLEMKPNATVMLHGSYGLFARAAAQYGDWHPAHWRSEAGLPRHGDIDVVVPDMATAGELATFLEQRISELDLQAYLDQPMTMDSMLITIPHQIVDNKPCSGFLTRFMMQGCRKKGAHSFYKIDIQVRKNSEHSLVKIHSPLQNDRTFTLPVVTWEQLWEELGRDSREENAKVRPRLTCLEKAERVFTDGGKSERLEQLHKLCLQKGLDELVPRSITSSPSRPITILKRPPPKSPQDEYTPEPTPKSVKPPSPAPVAIKTREKPPAPEKVNTPRKRKIVHFSQEDNEEKPSRAQKKPAKKPPKPKVKKTGKSSQRDEPRGGAKIRQVLTRFLSQHHQTLYKTGHLQQMNLVLDIALRLQQAWSEYLLDDDELEQLWQQIIGALPDKQLKRGWLPGAEDIVFGKDSREKATEQIILARRIASWRNHWSARSWYRSGPWLFREQAVALKPFWKLQSYLPEHDQLMQKLDAVVIPGAREQGFAQDIVLADYLINQAQSKNCSTVLLSARDKQAFLIHSNGFSLRTTISELSHKLFGYVTVYLILDNGSLVRGFWQDPDEYEHQSDLTGDSLPETPSTVTLPSLEPDEVDVELQDGQDNVSEHEKEEEWPDPTEPLLPQTDVTEQQAADPEASPEKVSEPATFYQRLTRYLQEKKNEDELYIFLKEESGSDFKLTHHDFNYTLSALVAFILQSQIAAEGVGDWLSSGWSNSGIYTSYLPDLLFHRGEGGKVKTPKQDPSTRLEEKSDHRLTRDAVFLLWLLDIDRTPLALLGRNKDGCLEQLTLRLKKGRVRLTYGDWQVLSHHDARYIAIRSSGYGGVIPESQWVKVPSVEEPEANGIPEPSQPRKKKKKKKAAELNRPVEISLMQASEEDGYIQPLFTSPVVNRLTPNKDAPFGSLLVPPYPRIPEGMDPITYDINHTWNYRSSGSSSRTDALSEQLSELSFKDAVETLEGELYSGEVEMATEDHNLSDTGSFKSLSPNQ
ncbi:hypothetical protein [Parendozoicomonas haliclonae]|uniref:Uncharacterized protein n=1 Tax=Parendozoicomonas haliclonae TaxID=1960125 RepID=A0A1X7AI47_9GAMM|nr:hypothetical protein [Parendozoicomonas haliclonae]SMA42802.1 hypothetical protein EHSB41UT_01489 [Parendozoicomonas haliclonae]